MEKKYVGMFLIFTLVFLLLPVSGFSTGLGIYIPTYGSGNATVNVGDSDYDYEYDINHIGLGFVLDTRVARRGVFNYRLNIGFESVDYGRLDDEKFSRFTLDNTFGFGVLQTKVVRLWIGPQLRIGYMNFGAEYYDINLFGAGLAPVLGANFNLGSVISICPEIGYRFEVYGGLITYNEDGYSYYNEDEDFSSVNQEFFVKLSIIFRMGDVFDDFY